MPAIASTFETQEPFLQELLEKVHAGRIQSYGAALFMETGGDGLNSAPPLVQGAPLAGVRVQPDKLILDGPRGFRG